MVKHDIIPALTGLLHSCSTRSNKGVQITELHSSNLPLGQFFCLFLFSFAVIYKTFIVLLDPSYMYNIHVDSCALGGKRVVYS